MTKPTAIQARNIAIAAARPDTCFFDDPHHYGGLIYRLMELPWDDGEGDACWRFHPTLPFEVDGISYQPRGDNCERPMINLFHDVEDAEPAHLEYDRPLTEDEADRWVRGESFSHTRDLY